jgi:hypothetical protein
MTENKTKQKNIFKAIFTKSDPDSAIPILAIMTYSNTLSTLTMNIIDLQAENTYPEELALFGINGVT